MESAVIHVAIACLNRLQLRHAQVLVRVGGLCVTSNNFNRCGVRTAADRGVSYPIDLINTLNRTFIKMLAEY